MKSQRRMVLPIAGRIQHGEKQGNKVVDLKRFIAKSQNDNMKFLADRFNQNYPNCNSLKIKIFDEEPLYIRYARYNTGGMACYCKENEIKAKQKTQNKWQEVECSESCKFRQKDKNGKTVCNREAILKFMLPDICKDRIWIMQIKGQHSINNLDDYFSFQRRLGNSVVGDYNLFLFEKEQPTANGIYKNQVLNIVEAEDSQNQVINSSVSTNNTQNVEKDANINSKKLISDEQKQSTKPKEQRKEKQEQNIKSKLDVKQLRIETIDESKVTEGDYKNMYCFVSSKFKECQNEKGTSKYLFATFADTEDKQIEVIIPRSYTEDLLECDLGTVMIPELAKKGDFTYPKSMKYLNKCIKKAAA